MAETSDAALPELAISFERGDTEATDCSALADRLYEQFTAPHSAIPGVGAYEWNVSLLVIPDEIEQWWDSPASYWMRQKVRRARKLGYRLERIDRREWVDDIVAINTSLPERQGRPMSSGYLERPTYGALPEYSCSRHQIVTFGVIHEDGHLYAYSWIYQVGEMCLISTLLGHGEHLKAGVMSLLLFDAIKDLHESAGTRYAMYNLHDSGTDGLKFFKGKMGFLPYHVHWRLASGGAAPAAS